MDIITKYCNYNPICHLTVAFIWTDVKAYSQSTQLFVTEQLGGRFEQFLMVNLPR